MNIYFFSNNFNIDSFGGMETHRTAFVDFISKSYHIVKCSLTPIIHIDNYRFNSMKDFILYLLTIVNDEDIFFFNDCYWAPYFNDLRQCFNTKFILRSGGNDLFRAHVLTDDISLLNRQEYLVSTINKNIDLLIVNSNYSFYRNIEIGIKPKLMKKIRGGVDKQLINIIFPHKKEYRKVFDKTYKTYNKKILTIASRFVKFKGILEFLSNIKPLIRKENWFIQLIGDGPILEDILLFLKNEFPKESYVYLGTLNNENVLKQLLISDLLINPTIEYYNWMKKEYYIHTETMGRTMMEAISVGTPILATNVGGTSELFEENENIGVLVNNFDNIKNDIEKAMQTKTDITKVCDYSWKSLFTKYHSLFTSFKNPQIVLSLDVDGTLFKNKSDYDSFIQLISQRKKDILVIINTCRNIDKETLDLLFKSDSNYLIYNNGMNIYHKNSFSSPMTKDFFLKIVKVYHNVKLTHENCISIRFLNAKQIYELKKRIKNELPSHTIVEGNNIVKIVNLKYNKSVSLFFILKDIPECFHVISAGDSTNDILMLNNSDYAYCSYGIMEFIKIPYSILEKFDDKKNFLEELLNYE